MNSEVLELEEEESSTVAIQQLVCAPVQESNAGGENQVQAEQKGQGRGNRRQRRRGKKPITAPQFPNAESQVQKEWYPESIAKLDIPALMKEGGPGPKAGDLQRYRDELAQLQAANALERKKLLAIVAIEMLVNADTKRLVHENEDMVKTLSRSLGPMSHTVAPIIHRQRELSMEFQGHLDRSPNPVIPALGDLEGWKRLANKSAITMPQ